MEPFKVDSFSTDTEDQNENKNGVKSIPKENNKSNLNQSSLYERLYKKDTNVCHSTSSQPNDKCIIDSRTLDNVSEKSFTDDDSPSESSDTTIYDENAQNISNDAKTSLHTKLEPGSKNPKIKIAKLEVQTRMFNAMLADLKDQKRKIYKFRAVPKKWNNSQMCDVFITNHNTPAEFDAKSIYVMNCESLNDNGERFMKEYYVNVRKVTETIESPKNIYTSLEINDILLAQMKIPKFSRITLCGKKTVLNFVEKIELIPTDSCDKEDILEDFKRLLIKCSRASPLLINQEQIFKLCGDHFVIAKVHPQSFRYCLCDYEILRENKLVISETMEDISHTLTAAEDILFEKNDIQSGALKYVVRLNENEKIIESCVENIKKNNCLDESNRLRKPNNYIIIGSQTTGKSTIIRKIIDSLQRPPYWNYVDVFNCAQNKARKVSVILIIRSQSIILFITKLFVFV